MFKQVKIESRDYLTGLSDDQDACVDRMAATLRAKVGVEDAHRVEADADEPSQLCVHYDPARLSLVEVRSLARQTGADLVSRYGHLSVRSQAFHARQARRVQSRIERLDGVVGAAVSPDGKIAIEFERPKTDSSKLTAALSELVTLDRDVGHTEPAHGDSSDDDDRGDHDDHDHGGGGKATALTIGLAGALLLFGYIASGAGLTPAWLALGATISSYGLLLVLTLSDVYQSFRARRLEIDSLMLVAALGAAALGEWAEGALLLFLFSLGHALEHYAMGRAKRAIAALGDLAPRTAWVRRGDDLKEVPIDTVQVDDVVVVRPNARIPADGFVVKGESAVDQAPITGESVPVDKRPAPRRDGTYDEAARTDRAHRVFAGTVNGNGALEVQVTRPASDSALARMADLVGEAQAGSSPTQQLATRFERLFVPIVLGGVVLLLFAWVVIDETAAESFYRAMAVLVAASPCALAISTPSAVLSGIARAARGGVLVKGGRALENLGRITAFAFDKTGTLTEGRPQITDVVPMDGVTDRELLQVAVAVERLSDHPLAKAVTRDGIERLAGAALPPAQSLESIIGRGVKARLSGEDVYIGSLALFGTLDGLTPPQALTDVVTELQRKGRTIMVVRAGERYLGVVGLMDTPRPGVADVIGRLRALGAKRIIMISGDNQVVATNVATSVGIDEAKGDLMPEDKVRFVQSLLQRGGVAMVGDGVNDSPALATATVGIAMGAAGSTVALETADVALMADDLSHLPFAVGLSRRASAIIKQNLWISLAVVAFLIPATIAGLQIGPAVALHEGSTLLVIGNALRLLGYQTSPPEQA